MTRLVTLRYLSRHSSLNRTLNSSSKMSQSFLVTKNMSEKYFEKATSKYVMDMWEHERDMNREELLKRVKGKNGLFCTLVDKVDAQLLDAAGPQLKMVSTLSVGYDHIDVEECRKRGVRVGNTPDVLTDAVAELTMALLLATTRRLFEANRALRQGEWLPGWGHFFMCGWMVKNSVVGFVGAGRIGISIMKRLRAFEPSRILYSTRNRAPAVEHLGASHVSLDQLLTQSDIVIVCCSLNDTTRHLLSTSQFKMMKSNAVLINTSRGAVVDQAALYEALRTKTIGAAGLDVMEVEPMPTDDPLLQLDNAVLLPHIGSATFSTREAMIQMAVDNLVAGLDGKSLVASVWQ